MTQAYRNWAAERGAIVERDLVLHFGDPQAEYHAGRNGVALFDRSDRGRLRISGADARDVLHRTTTGDLKDFPAGRCALTVIQTETARILDMVLLLAVEDGLIAVTGTGRAAADREWIDRVVIMDDVIVDDISGATGLFEIVGPLASETARRLVSADPPAAGEHRLFAWKNAAGRIAAEPGAGPPRSFWILVERGDPREFEEALVAAGLGVSAGHLASEALRIESGRPEPGRELTEETNPLEAGLEAALSATKGCYPGQEVIARMITYKSLKRTLRGVVLDEAHETEGPAPGEWFAVDVPDGIPPAGRPPGRLTSLAWSYEVGRPAGLAIVPLDIAAAGTAVVVATSAGPRLGRVHSLPLVP